MSPPVRPRTPKGRNSRRRIIDSAREVFARDGYTATRVLDIAETASLSLGAVYRYFGNKDEIFEAVMQELHEELYRATHVDGSAALNLQLDPYGTMFQATRAYLEVYQKQAGLLRALHEASTLNADYRQLGLRGRRRFRDRTVRRLQDVADPDMPLSSNDQLLLQVEVLIHMTEYSAYIWLAQGTSTDGGSAPDLDTAAAVLTDVWYGTLFNCREDSLSTPKRPLPNLERVAL
ncbi:MAG: TetR/AcrR family transcriptional regulator [Dehalococcoidia bacterium]